MTPAITPNQSQIGSAAAPGAPTGQDRTPQDPQQVTPDQAAQQSGLSDEAKQKLIDLRLTYKLRWHLVRRRVMRRVLKMLEFFKGNQYISWDPDNFTWFDPIESTIEGSETPDDVTIMKYCTNIYQMLARVFIATLSQGTPKTRLLPKNADREEDIATAKGGSILNEVIEQQNNIRRLVKNQLMHLWTGGVYFCYTRYVIDGDRAGYHKEPVVDFNSEAVLAPDRFICPECGTEMPSDQVSFTQVTPQCPNCGAQLAPEDFHEEQQGELPVQGNEKDVPNGMVRQSIYGLLNVDVAPCAEDILDTPILDLELEVDVGSLRASFPKAWNEIRAAAGSTGTVEGDVDRLARQRVWSALGGRNNLVGEYMPTYSRCWFKPESFNEVDDQDLASQLKQAFPQGCVLMTVGTSTFLDVRAERMADHWTVCKTYDGYGMNPPGAGDSAADVQERLNDVMNIVHEHMNRNASPTILCDEDAISTKALNGRPIPPGSLTPVKRKKEQQGRPLSDLMFQPTFHTDANIYNYTEKLISLAWMLTGVQPQAAGAGTQPGVETASGQQAQLNTALTQLNLFWEQMREETATRAYNAVRSAIQNLNEDIVDSLLDESKDFVNRYVRLVDMRGEFIARPETDQGFPSSFAEIRDRLTQILEMAAKNPFISALLEEPKNQSLFAQYLAPEGVVIPGESERQRVMRIIEQLVNDQPQPQLDPQTGAPTMAPSVHPIPDIDDPKVIEIEVKRWVQSHYEVADENPAGWQNLLAFYQEAMAMGQQKAMQDAMAQAGGPGVPPGGPAAGVPPGAPAPMPDGGPA